MSLTSKVIFGIAVLFLAGCAHTVADYPKPHDSDIRHETDVQLGDVLDRHLSAMRRMYQAGGPLLLANTDLCPRQALTLGFETISDFDLPKDLQQVAYERALLGKDARVLGVIPTAPAWAAGVRPGDTVVILNGKRVRNAADWRARVRRLKSDAPVQIGLIRDGRVYAVTIAPQPFCNYRLLYDDTDPDLNAYSDGQSVTMTSRMIDFTSDDELALIIGHELAHNIMHHLRKEETNAGVVEATADVIDVMTGFIGLGDPAQKLMDYMEEKLWSQSFENEADYVGLYMVARAGGNIDGAANLERRLGVDEGAVEMVSLRNPLTIRTHPMSPERAMTQSMTIKEIHDKQRRGDTLMPNLRIPWVYGQKYSRWDENDEEDPWIDDDLNH